MDFDTLNRRQLQSLCKLNKIPANTTNVAMADALKSLLTVEGIEDILNPSRSETVGSLNESPEKVEVMSPRVPRTTCRTSTRQKVKKVELETMPATASRVTSRGVRRNLGGDVSVVKTPSVTSTRKKLPTTASRQNVLSQLNECEEGEKSECLVDDEKKCIPSTPAAVATGNRRKVTTASARQNTVKKETTVQGVYSTRRSTRLTAKKLAEVGVAEKERSEPVKISSFLDEVSVTSEADMGNAITEKSTGSGSGSIETSNESSVSSANTEDNVEEDSAESRDVGVSQEKVEDICNAFEKLDVLVEDGSDQNSKDEKPLQVDATLKSETKKEDTSSKLDYIKMESVEMFEELVKVNEEEISGQVDNVESDSETVSTLCEDGDSEYHLMVTDEKNDISEALNVSVNEENVCLVPDEHFENKIIQVEDLKHDSEVISGLCKDGDSNEKSMVIDEKNDQNEPLNVSVNGLNARLAPEKQSEEKSIEVDVLKQDSEVMPSLCEDAVSEEKMTVTDERNDLHEALNVSANKQNAYLASEEHFEEKNIQVDNLKQDLEVISNLSRDGDSEKLLDMDEKVNLSEALDVSVKEQNAYLTETNDMDAAAVSSDLESPSYPSNLISEDMSAVSEMKNEVLDNNDDFQRMMEENFDVQQIIAIADALAYVSSDELEMNMEFEDLEEGQDSLIHKTVVDLMPTVNQEPDVTSDQLNQSDFSFITEKNQFTTNSNVIENPISNNSLAFVWGNKLQVVIDTQVSDNNENTGNKQQDDMAEEDQSVIEKSVDEKPTSLHDVSIRQLKKQLKALTIKNNMDTNKDDKMVEARPALQAVCENQLTTGEMED